MMNKYQVGDPVAAYERDGDMKIPVLGTITDLHNVAVAGQKWTSYRIEWMHPIHEPDWIEEKDVDGMRDLYRKYVG